ncbi:amino acid adenylation domain-containing protein [bacterium]|nr:amino acid adenylation domain-containing protein [bacterium]
MTNTNIAESLQELYDQGIQLWADASGQLRFRAPRGALTEDRRTWLRHHKTEVLAYLQGATEFPLSFGQERLWFLDRLEPASAFYNVPFTYRLRGALNPTALEQSLNAVVARHAILRSSFTTREGRPVQVIQSKRRVPFLQVDLRLFPACEREAEAQRQLATDANTPFELAAGPLFRAILFQLEEHDWLLFLNLHHIVADGWSIRNVFHPELASLYQGFCSGEAPPLPVPPFQFSDLARWQRQSSSDPHLAQQLDYWRQQLAGCSGLLQLPTDHPRPMSQTFRGSMELFTFPPSLYADLKALSRAQSVTMASTLQAAFSVLLHRYTGQEDILIGFPIANRSDPDLEKLVGFITNTLVLRTNLAGNPTFTEVLARAHQTALEAIQHQDLPFAKLVQELQPDRYLNQTPFFQVMFGMTSGGANDSLKLAGIEPAPMRIYNNDTAKFDLSLLISEDGETARVRLEYNLDLFERETMLRLVQHFVTLLTGIVTRPEERIMSLPLLPEGELAQLSRWNENVVDFPQSDCLPQRLAAQVERTPSQVAVLFTDEAGQHSSLTYDELNCRANRLAHFLQGLGVGPNHLVGICIERSLDMVVGLLAILKTGGACVALDPTYPQETLQFMIQDSGMAVLLTQEKLLSRLPQGSNLTAICMDTIWQTVADPSDHNPKAQVSGEDLVYAIYTSGSTGLPKGIGFPHRALANILQWHLKHPILGRKARTVQYSTFGFCVSFQEIFLTWLTGGTLVLIPDAIRRDMTRMARFLAREAIEALYLPFTALKNLAEVYAEDAAMPLPTSLRAVVTAGEPLHLTSSLRSWFSRLGDCSLHNQFGASETHVVTTCTLGPLERWPSVAPIGRAVANTQIHILDRQLQPVPIGIPGELCVAGVALANGYLNDPELTRQKFLANPFERPQAAWDRLYRTGDLARYRSDGSLEHLGRIDQQVKIRGFRLELEAVESVIRQFSTIRDVVVLVPENDQGIPRLIAYVVACDDGRGDWASTSRQAALFGNLRRFLKTRLPDFMVPAVYLLVDELPLNVNGKLDRQALLALLAQERPELETSFVAPRTEMEKTLAEIWANVLGLERVGVFDNFFDLGGHSLLATLVVSRVRTALQVELPLHQLFEAPTVVDLAIALTQISAQSVDSDLLTDLLAQFDPAGAAV